MKANDADGNEAGNPLPAAAGGVVLPAVPFLARSLAFGKGFPNIGKPLKKLVKNVLSLKTASRARQKVGKPFAEIETVVKSYQT
jgi:hypothetical protein